MLRGWLAPPIERTERAETIERMQVKSDVTLRKAYSALDSYRRARIGR